jgi:hypothetical protein
MIKYGCLLLPALFLAGCASTSAYSPVSASIRFAYPRMGFRGSYCKELTVDDVRQIVALAKSRPDILKPIGLIDIDRPDIAKVESDPSEGSVTRVTSFEVRKKNGRWMVIEGSIQTNQVIITG